VSGGRDGLEAYAADVESVPVPVPVPVSVRDRPGRRSPVPPIGGRRREDARHSLVDRCRYPGDVVGADVGVDRVAQFDAALASFGTVGVDGRPRRVDDRRRSVPDSEVRRTAARGAGVRGHVGPVADRPGLVEPRPAAHAGFEADRLERPGDVGAGPALGTDDERSLGFAVYDGRPPDGVGDRPGHLGGLDPHVRDSDPDRGADRPHVDPGPAADVE